MFYLWYFNSFFIYCLFMIGNFSFRSSTSLHNRNRKPILTMYTKEDCSLCDDLIEELLPFKDTFELEKIYITKKENIKYLRLYRYDIPVVFFAGRYLCMHKLNLDLFKKHLEQYNTDNK